MSEQEAVEECRARLVRFAAEADDALLAEGYQAIIGHIAYLEDSKHALLRERISRPLRRWFPDDPIEGIEE